MSDETVPQLTRLLGELQQVQRELLEQRYVRRADGLDQVTEALRHLGEVGSPAGIIARCAEALGAASDFDTVLVSRLDGDLVQAQTLWIRDDEAAAATQLAALHRRAMPLRYPLIEAEIAQRHEPTIVSVPASGRRAAPEFSQTLGWTAYAVADISLEGKVVGFVHAARRDGAELDDVDLELVSLYAEGLAQVFERAVLREQLERQQTQLRSAAQWMGAQMTQLSTRATAHDTPLTPRDDGDIAELLTSRELDVLRLIARGNSNREIADALMIGEGTVKYHVKNILRKLQARSRAEAVSRYMSLSGTVDGQ